MLATEGKCEALSDWLRARSMRDHRKKKEEERERLGTRQLSRTSYFSIIFHMLPTNCSFEQTL